jgi:hypothetical protein
MNWQNASSMCSYGVAHQSAPTVWGLAPMRFNPWIRGFALLLLQSGLSNAAKSQCPYSIK